MNWPNGSGQLKKIVIIIKKKQLPWPENSREKNTYNSVRLVALKRKEQCCPQCPASITYLHFLGPRVSSGIFWYLLVSSLRAMCIFASTNEMGRSPHCLCLSGCAVSSLATEQDILQVYRRQNEFTENIHTYSFLSFTHFIDFLQTTFDFHRTSGQCVPFLLNTECKTVSVILWDPSQP